MRVTLLASELTDGELRTIGAQHQNKEKLEEIAKELDNDKFRLGLIERTDLSDELIDYILKSKNKSIYEKFAKRNCNTRMQEKKLLDLQSREVDQYLMMNDKIDGETLKDISERYADDKNWQDRIFFHNSAGDYFFGREFNRIKQLDFKEVIDLKEKLLRIAEKTESEEILEQLVQIELWENYSKYNEQLQNLEERERKNKKDKIEEVFEEVCLKVAENHNSNAKTLYLIAKNKMRVDKINDRLVESILYNPKTCGFTIAYIVAIFSSVDFLSANRYIKARYGKIIDIVKNHFENVK